MSDVMLHGVLRMPPELWRDDPMDVSQRHSRYIEASERIEADAREIERLRDGISYAAEELGALDDDTAQGQARDLLALLAQDK